MGWEGGAPPHDAISASGDLLVLPGSLKPY